MPRSKGPRKKSPSQGGGRGGAMTSLRAGTRKLVGTGDGKKKPVSFWDVLFWVAAGGAVLYLLLQRLG